MEIFLLWFLFLSIQTAATISPGPAFALTVRNAIAHDRAAGIFTAFGLGGGIIVHMVFILTGLSVVLTKYPFLFVIIKYVGAAYLIYLGIRGLKSQKKDNDIVNQNATAKNPNRSKPSFLTQGLMTNALNPKAWIFFPAVFTQFVSPETPLEIMLLFATTSVAVETIWFIFLTLFLTNPKIRKTFLGISHWIERVCGGLLIGLGVKLIFDKGLKIAS